MTYLEIKNLVERIANIDDIGAKTRKRKVADARFVYYELCKNYTPIPLPGSESKQKIEIGAAVGRDRTSVIHGYLKFDELSQDDLWWGKWLYKLCLNIARNEKRRQLWVAPKINIAKCTENEFAISK